MCYVVQVQVPERCCNIFFCTQRVNYLKKKASYSVIIFDYIKNEGRDRTASNL